MVNYMYYINNFFVYSIIGFFTETLIYTAKDSGILFLWWTPVYGIGVNIIILIDKYIKKIKTTKFLKLLLLFFISAISLSLTEALGGYLLKWIFGKELWNYSTHKFNIGKYTSLEMCLVWGIGSIIFTYILKPLTDKIISKIPKYLTYILILIFILDIIMTLITKV